MFANPANFRKTLIAVQDGRNELHAVNATIRLTPKDGFSPNGVMVVTTVSLVLDAKLALTAQLGVGRSLGIKPSVRPFATTRTISTKVILALTGSVVMPHNTTTIVTLGTKTPIARFAIGCILRPLKYLFRSQLTTAIVAQSHTQLVTRFAIGFILVCDSGIMVAV
jgi:hypothetical protein